MTAEDFRRKGSVKCVGFVHFWRHERTVDRRGREGGREEVSAREGLPQVGTITSVLVFLSIVLILCPVS